jgi:CHRD domain
MRRSTRVALGAVAAVVALLAAGAVPADEGPDLVWSPSADSFDFGSVAAGHTASATFTLSGTKGQLTDITVTVSGSSAFTITGDGCTGLKTRVAAKHDRSCDVTVQYAPVSAADTATLTAVADKPDASASITLTASGALHFVAAGPAVPGLSPLNENPAHPESHASGTANVTWDTTTNMMTVDVTFTGLTTPNTAAHIHCCVTTPGGTAGVATSVPTFTGFPSGTQSGTYTHTFDMLNAASYNPSFVTSHGGTVASAEAALLAGLEAGQTYLNVHTVMFGGGEIRGFLQPS